MTLEEAYDEINRRGWGFASGGEGFGDPQASWTAVGPMRDGLVEVWGMDKNAVRAVEKAIATEAKNAAQKS